MQHDRARVFADMEASPLLILPSALLIAAVYRSSLKLKRHTLPQLLIGSVVSLLACGISIWVYGLG